jgi:acetyl esterase/lipase
MLLIPRSLWRPFAAWLLLSIAPVAAAETVPFDLVDDVVYGHKDGLALTLDVVTPKQQPKGLGVILVFSGGWHSSKSDVAEENQRRLEREHWVQGLLKGGYTVFIARHGSAPRYRVPEMIEDTRRAVRFVRYNANRYQIDPDGIGITSGSSGGHLALMAATTGDDGRADAKDPIERVSSRVQAVVAWFPPTDMVNWNSTNGYHDIEKLRPGLLEEMFGKITNLEEQLKSISPLYFVTPDDPPLLLLHGDKDPIVPLQQSQLLEAKYREVGLPVKLVVHPGGGHTSWRGILDDYATVWAWFDQYLRPDTASR